MDWFLFDKDLRHERVKLQHPPSRRAGFISFNESPLKMMKNVFYFTSKTLSILKYLSFFLDFLVFYQNGLIRKIRLISKFMTSQPGKQTMVIHVLPNILRNKDNQAIKFGQS